MTDVEFKFQTSDRELFETLMNLKKRNLRERRLVPCLTTFSSVQV